MSQLVASGLALMASYRVRAVMPCLQVSEREGVAYIERAIKPVDDTGRMTEVHP
jgi:hypothetical protein